MGRTIGIVAYRILVVDDDPNVLRLFDHILTRGGYEVHTAGSGKKGLDLLDTAEPFDLLDHGSLSIYAIMISSILYFQRNTTGAALISSKYW